jgi:serine/threonine protein kinase
MLAGIKAIHDRSVLHLDIKPENCVWDPETKTLKFLDFGIARSFIPGGHRDEAYLCAPAYRAPSAWIQEGLNEVLDLFALGVVIAELFRGFQERLFPIDPRASHPDLRARIARLGISSFADLERYPVYKEFLIERDGELHFRDGMRPAIDPLPRFLEKGLERRGGRDGELLGLVKELLANLLSRTPDVSRAIDLVQAHQDGFLLDRPPAT